MYLKSRLVEIKERLGPVTKELGFSHKLRDGWGEEMWLTFERTDENGGRWLAPVGFIFPPREVTGEEEISWKHVRIGLSETRMMPIGTNGWFCYSGEVNNKGEQIGPSCRIPDADSAFAHAEDWLRNHAPLPLDVDLPYVVGNALIERDWADIEALLKESGIEQIEFGRRQVGKQSREFFTFEHLGRQWEISYEEFGEMEVSVDGELRNTSKPSWPGDVVDTLEFVFEQETNGWPRSRR